MRSAMYHVAGFIDYWTKGRVKPAHITALSVFGHVFVAWALIVNRPIWAAVFLAFFGLLDGLDGALARYQGSASRSGMYFDAVSDRLKEVILYSALAIFAYEHYDSNALWQIVALCGSSLLVSYTKAKGEMAIAGRRNDVQALNRQFGVGIASYEVRMTVIIFGLLFGILELIIPLLVAANLLTVAARFLEVSKLLHAIDLSEQKNKSSKK